MNKILIPFSLIVSLFIVGCAGTSFKVDRAYAPAKGDNFSLNIEDSASMSAEGMEILRSRLIEQLQSKNILKEKNSKLKLNVKITTYNMRHGASRAMLGVMAGSDRIISTITILDQQSNNIIGVYKVNSKNPSAWGTSRGLIEEHADTIVSYLNGN